MYHRNIFNISIFILLFINAHAQDSPFRKGGDFQYRDSLIVIGNDSIKIIHGTNHTLNLHFWSRDLFQQIEYYKTNSKQPRPISNLYSFSGESYLADLPDTTLWKSFENRQFGIFMKYLPELEVMIRYDSIDYSKFIEFGFSNMDTIGKDYFVPWIRISYHLKIFFKKLVSMVGVQNIKVNGI
ncbi:MAG: hypothetical protein Q7S39_10605 [Ignavibacteria bacterium]|nr:hypothetical protein [Ignavibacteria bacterium]